LETKNIKILLFTVALLMLNACYHINENEIVKPDNFFDKQKMINILTDAQIVEGALNFNRINRINVTELKEEYYNQVFIKYNITAYDFKQNMDYYNSKPDEMEEILDGVLEKLNQIQAQLEQKIADEKAVKDSLNQVRIQDSIAVADSLKTIENTLPGNN